VRVRLFAGDDWAGDHHDVEVMGEAGRALARRRPPGGAAGMGRPRELVGERLGEGADGAGVAVGIGAGRGPRVLALVAAGYTVVGVNPLRASRFRGRLAVPGAESGGAGARMLAGMARTGSRRPARARR
jgi:Transposase